MLYLVDTSFDQYGVSHQRIVALSRSPSAFARNTTTGSVGAMLCRSSPGYGWLTMSMNSNVSGPELTLTRPHIVSAS